MLGGQAPLVLAVGITQKECVWAAKTVRFKFLDYSCSHWCVGAGADGLRISGFLIWYVNLTTVESEFRGPCRILPRTR